MVWESYLRHFITLFPTEGVLFTKTLSSIRVNNELYSVLSADLINMFTFVFGWLMSEMVIERSHTISLAPHLIAPLYSLKMIITSNIFFIPQLAFNSLFCFFFLFLAALYGIGIALFQTNIDRPSLKDNEII